MKRTRLQPDARKEAILEAALALAVQHGYTNVTRMQISEAARCSPPTIQYHFGTMNRLRRDLMRYAVRYSCLPVIAQGLAAGDTQARKAPDDVKRDAMSSVL